jgi:hypothetical protein
MEMNHLSNCDWFVELETEIRKEVERLDSDRLPRSSALEEEIRKLEEQKQGWRMSLGDSDLDSCLRAAIQDDWVAANRRQEEIRRILSDQQNRQQSIESAVDRRKIVECLNRLDEIVAGDNATTANLELSLHIDSIRCFPNGKVVLRTCRLGALAEALPLVQDESAMGDDSSSEPDVQQAITRRRRTKLRVDTLGPDAEQNRAAANFAADPDRFAGLEGRWFWEDVFEIPRRLSWAERNAEGVAEFRLKKEASMEVTAEHFRKTVPTIRAALRFAKQIHGIDAFGKSVSRSNLPNWPRANATAVAAYFADSTATMKGAVAYFGKSDTTLRKALKLAREQHSHSKDDHHKRSEAPESSA